MQQQFPANAHFCGTTHLDTKITSAGFILCLAIVLGLWKAVNGC